MEKRVELEKEIKVEIPRKSDEFLKIPHSGVVSLRQMPMEKQ